MAVADSENHWCGGKKKGDVDFSSRSSTRVNDHVKIISSSPLTHCFCILIFAQRSKQGTKTKPGGLGNNVAAAHGKVLVLLTLMQLVHPSDMMYRHWFEL